MDRFEQIMALRDRLGSRWHNGTVRWFDPSSGEGMVALDDGTSLYCHFTAIDGVAKNNNQWPDEADLQALERLNYNTPCRVVAYISCGYVGCERVLVTTLDGEV